MSRNARVVLPIIAGWISDGRPIRIFLDSGSAPSIVRSGLVAKPQKSYMRYSTVSGEALQVEGRAKFDFYIGDEGVSEASVNTIDALVMRRLPYDADLLLGLRDLITAGLSLTPTGVATSTGRCQPYSRQGWEETAAVVEAQVVLGAATTIPARSSLFVTVDVPGVRDVCVIIEDDNDETDFPLLARALCYVDEKGQAEVVLTNTSEMEIQVEAGETIGTARLDYKAQVAIVAPEGQERKEREPVSKKKWRKLFAPEASESLVSMYHARIHKYLQVFRSKEEKPQMAQMKGVTPHTIQPIQSWNPVRIFPRPLPPDKARAAMDGVEELRQFGAIEDAKESEWSNNVVLIKKPDGTLRFCVDLRSLNAQTRAIAHPLPRMADISLTLRGHRVFSRLDLLRGYWQFPIDAASKPLTAFSIYGRKGLESYQFKSLVMGMRNGAAVFQRAIELILSGMTWKSVVIYIDDILIMSKDHKQHAADLEEVLKRLDQANIYANLDKSELARDELDFIGHHVTSGGRTVACPKKLQQIAEFKEPKTFGELEAFLGIVGFIRSYVPDLAMVDGKLRQLHTRMRKIKNNQGQAISLNQEEKASFTAIQQRFRNSVSHSPPALDESFTIYTDASATGIGAVLVQGVNIVDCYSRTLSPTQRRYSTIEREALAIVMATGFWRHMIDNSMPLLIRTDHRPLQELLYRNFDSPRLKRFALALMDLPVRIGYYPGRLNTLADFLSRAPQGAEGQTGDVPFMEEEGAAAAVQLATPTRGNDFTSTILSSYHETDLGDARWKTDEKGLLRDKQGGRIYVGRRGGARLEIIENAHSRAVGHLGIAKTYAHIAHRFTWRGLKPDVYALVRACLPCLRVKGRIAMSRSIRPIQSAYPLHTLCLDHLSVPECGGCSEILVMIDHFSKFCWCFPVPDRSARTTAKYLWKWIMEHTPPARLLSDRGGAFMNTLMEEVNSMFGVKGTFTSPYHPQTDGATERMNRTLLMMLTLAVEDPSRWRDALPVVVHAYNDSRHQATGAAPSHILFGVQPHSVEDLELGLEDKRSLEGQSYAEGIKFLVEARRIVQASVSGQMRKQGAYWMKRQESLEPYRFTVGEFVIVRDLTLQHAAPRERKLRPAFGEPVKIVEVIDASLIRVADRKELVNAANAVPLSGVLTMLRRRKPRLLAGSTRPPPHWSLEAFMDVELEARTGPDNGEAEGGADSLSSEVQSSSSSESEQATPAVKETPREAAIRDARERRSKPFYIPTAEQREADSAILEEEESGPDDEIHWSDWTLEESVNAAQDTV